VTLLALRAVGVMDARARGLVCRRYCRRKRWWALKVTSLSDVTRRTFSAALAH